MTNSNQIIIPPNFPNHPSPAKLSLLFQANKMTLWHKFSPYTDNDGTFGLFPNKQPFIYRFPDQSNAGLNRLPTAVKTILSAGNISQSSVDDVVRVSKFTISPQGILYNIKQFGLQRLQPFDETRIYNPLSPILATVAGMTFGIGLRPMRHIEGGLLGLLSSITSTVGISLQSGYQTPTSTAGNSALPTYNTGQGKGLLRGADATKAKNVLSLKWANNNRASGGILSGFTSMLRDAVNSVFGSATGQPSGTVYRADEQTSDMMYNSKKIYNDRFGRSLYYSWMQPWYGNNAGQKPTITTKLWPRPQTIIKNTLHPIFINSSLAGRIKVKLNGSSIGYDNNNSKSNNYNDYIHPTKDGEYTNSDTLINYADFIDPKKKYDSKFIDFESEKVKKINDGLTKAIEAMTRTIDLFSVNKFTNNSRLLSSAPKKDEFLGYDRIPKDISRGKSSYGVGLDYYDAGAGTQTSKPIDKSFSTKNLKMAMSFNSDGLNQIGVLNKDKKFNTATKEALIKSHPNWVEYKPYEDDLIAFFFYDIVNNRYIPFRATVKGISEGNTAFWDELRFIGRSDQLYSYNGFSRTLSFTFNVVVSSLSELMPTWQKINYMASCVKPSNYTTGRNSTENQYSRFIVPPMFMLTIGDMYKYQPIVITSVNVNIPDDAAWETLNEDNAKDGWHYLNGIITSPKVGSNFAQMPREAEIAITCNLLEKERAIVGGSHFGHAPNSDGVVTEFQPKPTEFHKALIIPDAEQRQREHEAEMEEYAAGRPEER